MREMTIERKKRRKQMEIIERNLKQQERISEETNRRGLERRQTGDAIDLRRNGKKAAGAKKTKDIKTKIKEI